MLSYPPKPYIVCILTTFLALSRKFKKNYCFPTQQKILKLLNHFYSFRVCRSTLNNYLSPLEAQGLIRRIKRLKKLPSGAIHFASTVYILTHKTYELSHQFGSSFYHAGVRHFARAKPTICHPKPTLSILRYDPPPDTPLQLGDLMRKFISSL